MEPKKRPRRIPLSSEEVANLIAYRRQRELVELRRFKRTTTFKALNIFNVICFFIYLELLFCYFGPCQSQTHYSARHVTTHGYSYQKNGRPIVSEMDIFCVHGATYKFIIDDFIETPPQKTRFKIGKDYILQREIKGSFDNFETYYRLFSASPVLFLCIFTSIISMMGFFNNLNENMYSLTGLTVLNSLTLLGIIFI